MNVIENSPQMNPNNPSSYPADPTVQFFTNPEDTTIQFFVNEIETVQFFT